MSETFWKLVQCPNCNRSTKVAVVKPERAPAVEFVDFCTSCGAVFYFDVEVWAPFTPANVRAER